MDDTRYLIKVCNQIVRHTQAHMDFVLKKYGLSSGSYPYLLELKDDEGINLEGISKKIGVDKAMSTRTIQKLILGRYLQKIPDERDARASKLYLTEKAHAIIPDILAEIEKWIESVTNGLSAEEKSTAVNALFKISRNAREGQRKLADERNK